MMVDIVVPDLPFVDSDEVAVIVSGLGATPVMELYILQPNEACCRKRIRVYKDVVRKYFTSWK